MGLRSEFWQARHAVMEVASPRQFRRLLRSASSMKLPALAHRRRQTDEIWAVSVVRDELDVLPSVVDHLFSQGVDHVLIADNRSCDGTREWLTDRSLRDRRVHVARDENPAHDQSQKVTLLAHRAWRSGADWIVPFDADEFWFAKGCTVGELLSATSANIVHADFVHMVPTKPAPEDLIGCEYSVDTQPAFPGKVAFRSHPLAIVAPGNHAVTRQGPRVDGLAIAHIQYRSPTQIARKVRQGTAAARLTGEDLNWFSPHWEVGSRLPDDEIDEVWNNISQGRADERIQYKAYGPMLTLHPLLWRTWDPYGRVAKAQEPYRHLPRRGAH